MFLNSYFNLNLTVKVQYVMPTKNLTVNKEPIRCKYHLFDGLTFLGEGLELFSFLLSSILSITHVI